MDDAPRLYAWRTDAETVKQSIAPPPASLEAHRTWLAGALHDPDVSLYVAYDEERQVDVGSVRIHRRSEDEVEMSITVDPDQRGRGYSHDLIARGLEASGGARVVARVKAGNARSLRAFRALGFRDDGSGELVRLVHERSSAGGTQA
jgi:RimJ/RimL family protein N-acetyltransferase